jgi:hypothetical protein
MDTNTLVAHVCVVKVTTMKYNHKTSSFNDADLIREQTKNLNRNSCNSSSHNFITNCHSNYIKKWLTSFLQSFFFLSKLQHEWENDIFSYFWKFEISLLANDHLVI